MNWKDYSYLKASHAFLAPSKHYWLNYSEEKLVATYENYQRVSLGTRLHSLAEQLIGLSVRLPNTAASFNSFVNDAIGFKMDSEQVVYYSANCYGTVDAISYDDGFLRIHDLKTGATPGNMNQLMIYAALFCLDYKQEPANICLRIYQNEDVLEYRPAFSEVKDVMERIIEADKVIDIINSGTIF